VALLDHYCEIGLYVAKSEINTISALHKNTAQTTTMDATQI